ncbi:hypothetical protein PHLCEN_2v10935 [Hermanssonia centrifuga]|uniref:DUF6699 domain-containing protein n=1 Tax=Hermanssonia centrifuga TaxID=98765 RepID=A0A2R6NLJ1_9APHY|nr:hypothetical protein PHLCEN_2v10935 [Hermanssonia centrifuga]
MDPHHRGWPHPSTHNNIYLMPLATQSRYYPWLGVPCMQPVPAGMQSTSHETDMLMKITDLKIFKGPNHGMPGTIYPYIAAGSGPPLRFDLREDLHKSNLKEYTRHNHYSLFIQPTKHARFICKEFPWAIEIKGEWVVCGAVWSKIYEALQEDITESEWAWICDDERQRRELERAMKQRAEKTGDKTPRPKRIDWLGEMTIFEGLEKDDVYAKKILLPGKEECVETWVIRLGRR